MSTDTSPLARAAAEFPRHEPRPPGAPTALQGIRVVDFTHFIAGPLATMILADMGADVIKVEPPARGDELRYYPPAVPGLQSQGGPFVWSNRNKRSVALDLKADDALAVVRELIAQADVVVENFSTGVMQRFGLDWEACRKLNPKLVYCSVSAYGREGPFADRLGFDPVVQAESGFVSMNGYPDRMGVRASSAVMDIGTAMMVSNAILGALVARERHHVLHRLRKTAAAAIPDEEAALDALARFHHARDLQAAQCVACCRASDAEALGQFALAGELVARLQLAAHQLFANAVAHGLEATPGAHRLEERFVGHERSF